MLIALLLAAAFTAGLVNRVVERRLSGLVGRRAVPRRDHVVVAGLGQVGMRPCLLLRACRTPVVAVESDEDGESVGIAKELGLPSCSDGAAVRRSGAGSRCIARGRSRP